MRRSRAPVFSDLQQFRLGLLAFVIAVIGGLCLFGLYKVIRFGPKLRRFEKILFFSAFTIAGIGTACFIYAFFEAERISETYVELRTEKLPAGTKLRIVHLSDLHVDGPHDVYSKLPERVNALKPDLIIFTGDSLNAAGGLPVFRETLSKMNARLGRFAVRGNHDIWYWREQDLFGGGVATELTGTAVEVPDSKVTLCGAEFGKGAQAADCLDASSSNRYRVVVLHSPDLIEELAAKFPDLYLAGHTHGGQVRAPIYGALVTMSRFDKKYEMGRYSVGPTTLFVSRGIGVEPNAPRIRFNCPPEIAVIDLVGQ